MYQAKGPKGARGSPGAGRGAGAGLPRRPRRDRRPVSVPRLAWLIGPALVAGVAYLDPGNVASNMTAGAIYGYLLVWIVVLGNVMAWLIQYLSAKLGVVTGESLPEVLGRRIRNRWARRAYWVQAELVAMATDIAEVIGGAVALNLLFDVPLLWGGADHGRRLDGPARAAVPARPAHLRVRGHRAHGHHQRSDSPSASSSAPPIRRRRRRTRAALRGRRVGAARGIHPRRHDHAARDLRAQRARARPLRPRRRARRAGDPARWSLRAASKPGTDPERPRPAHRAGLAHPRRARGGARRHDRPAAAGDEVGCLDRDGHRRHGQPLHPAARRRQPRRRAGHRQPRGRARRARRDPRSGHRDDVRGRPARLGPRLDVRRRLRGRRDHAGPAARPRAAARAPPRHPDPGAAHPRRRLRPDARARAEPGGAVVRHPVRAHPARRAHRAGAHPRRIPQPPRHDDRRHPGIRLPHRPQRRAALARHHRGREPAAGGP